MPLEHGVITESKEAIIITEIKSKVFRNQLEDIHIAWKWENLGIRKNNAWNTWHITVKSMT